MKTFLNDNKLWIKMLIISITIYIIIYGILINAPIGNYITFGLGFLTIYIGNKPINIVHTVLALLIALSLIVIAIKAIIKLIKW